MKRLPPLVVSAITLMLTGCGDDASGAGHWTGTIDTLPSGTVLVSNPAEGIWTDETAWRLVEELRIGSVEGEGPHVFSQILRLEVDAAGRIYVLDRQAQEIRVFDRAGTYVRTIGRAGGGPGEFQSVNGFAMDGQGRLWVADRSHYAVFDTSGAFLRTYPRQVILWEFRWSGGFLENGALYDLTMAESGPSRSTALVRYDTTRGMVDTLVLPSYERPVWEFTSGTGRMMMAVPFGEGLARALDPRGYVWAGITDRYRLHQIDLSGDTVRIVERDYTPLPVTSAERDSVVDAVRERVKAPVDPSKIPSHKPVFGRVLVDDVGYLWVATTVPPGVPGTVFDVFDPGGRLLGPVTSPFSLGGIAKPVIRGDRLYAVATDELDVPYVVRLRIDGR